MVPRAAWAARIELAESCLGPAVLGDRADEVRTRALVEMELLGAEAWDLEVRCEGGEFLVIAAQPGEPLVGRRAAIVGDASSRVDGVLALVWELAGGRERAPGVGETPPSAPLAGPTESEPLTAAPRPVESLATAGERPPPPSAPSLRLRFGGDLTGTLAPLFGGFLGGRIRGEVEGTALGAVGFGLGGASGLSAVDGVSAARAEFRAFVGIPLWTGSAWGLEATVGLGGEVYELRAMTLEPRTRVLGAVRFDAGPRLWFEGGPGRARWSLEPSFAARPLAPALRVDGEPVRELFVEAGLALGISFGP